MTSRRAQEPIYYGIEEAARYVGVSRRTLERAVTQDRVSSLRNPLTGRRQFRQEDLDDLMRQGQGPRGAA